jgi:hypothetical protein
MSKLKKALLVLGAVYLALWAATRFVVPSALERQMLREAKAEWKMFRDQQEERKKEHPEWARFLRDDMASPNGPGVEVVLLSCPAPFLIRASTSRVIGGLNGGGTEGWYLFTPWRVYGIAVTGTWVS